MLQIENLHIPFNEEEERLIASIPSHVKKKKKLNLFLRIKIFIQTIPSLIDNELDKCLSQHSQKFWANRTIDQLRECWFQMRSEGKLNDQHDNSQQTQAIQGFQ